MKSGKLRPSGRKSAHATLQRLTAIAAISLFIAGLIFTSIRLQFQDPLKPSLSYGRRSGRQAQPRPQRSNIPQFMHPLDIVHHLQQSGPPVLQEPPEFTENIDGTVTAWRPWRLLGGVPIETEIGPVKRKARPGPEVRPQSRTLGEGVVRNEAASLAHTKYCELHFGMAWLRGWNATAKITCAAGNQKPEETSALICRSMIDKHMTASSAPHVLCNARRLLVDTSKFLKAACPKHRPHYLCHSFTYHRYLEGAFGLYCDWPDKQLSAFPKDHLRDIMESVQAFPAGPLSQVDATEPVAVLFVTREINEHANVFHALTDLLNVYVAVRTLGWEAVERQVVLLDSHPDGPFDALWAAVPGGGGLAALRTPWNSTGAGGQRHLRRAEDLQPRTLFERAVFVPPGYTSLLYAHSYEDNSCPHSTTLFRGFRRWMLQPLQLFPPSQALSPKIKVTFVSRKEVYDPRKKRKRTVTRRIGNEDAAVEALQQASPLVDVQLVDLAALNILQQFKLISETDILVGMHGAALAWTLMMREGAGLLELWPKPEGVWRCMEHSAEWSGLFYRRWVPERVGSEKDVTEVDIEGLTHVFLELVLLATEQRA